MRYAERPLTSFEAYCFNCQVTFPSETRHCLHCGERVVSPSRKRTGSSIEQIAKQFAKAARKREQATGPANAVLNKNAVLNRSGNAIEEQADVRLPSSVPAAPLPVEGIDDEIPARRFSPLTMIWIGLAVAGAALRDCSGG